MTVITPRAGNLWFTSDLHLGHENIIKYCDRPFRAVWEMNERLVANWNAVVAEEDDVWVLGDMCMGKLEETLELVPHLRGHKHLVAGNHDRCWSGNGDKHLRWIPRYEEAGFETIVEAAELILGGEICQVSHFPYAGAGDHTSDERYTEYRPVDHGEWLLHGHIHEKWRIRDRMVNVGVDVNNFTPVSAAELELLIQMYLTTPR